MTMTGKRRDLDLQAWHSISIATFSSKATDISGGSPAHANSPAVPTGGTQERQKSAVKRGSPTGFLGDFLGRTQSRCQNWPSSRSRIPNPIAALRLWTGHVAAYFFPSREYTPLGNRFQLVTFSLAVRDHALDLCRAARTTSRTRSGPLQSGNRRSRRRYQPPSTRARSPLSP